MISIPDHPPPSYIDRDIDLLSLRSAAPSYTSSIPPKYTPRYRSLITDGTARPAPTPTHDAYNVASWSSMSNQSQSRAYLNVAARRARLAQEAAQTDDAMRRVLRIVETATPPPPPSQATGSTTLVPRSYVDLGMEEALRHESRAWDFFTAQIHDWEQREINWKAFKAKHHTKKKNGGKTKVRSRWGFYGRLG